MSGRVFLGLTRTKQGLMCLAQGHNAVSLKPSSLPSKQSTTEPQGRGSIRPEVKSAWVNWAGVNSTPCNSGRSVTLIVYDIRFGVLHNLSD